MEFFGDVGVFFSRTMGEILSRVEMDVCGREGGGLLVYGFIWTMRDALAMSDLFGDTSEVVS